MTAVDIAALGAATIAGILALVAVFRAMAFYRMSARQAEQILAAEQNIAAGLRQFDRLFDTLYHDAMTLAKAAVFHSAETAAAPPVAPPAVSPAQPASSSLTGADIDEKLAAMKHEILDGLAAMLSRPQPPTASAEAMSAEMAEIIDRAITQSRSNS